MRVKPFAALRPTPHLVAEIASVPYDTVDSEEARALVDGHPWSFLRIGRPEVNLPRETDIYADAVYATARDVFSRFLAQGALIRETAPTCYLYRIEREGHVQCGVVACCAVGDYEQGIIKQHEKTRADKRADRRRLTDTLSAHTGPVFLMYRDDPAIDGLAHDVESGSPLYDFVAADGVRHTLWTWRRCEDLMAAFRGVPFAYIADGHHRAAAAVEVAAERRARDHRDAVDAEYNWFPAVLFPSSQLRILPYNRCVSSLNGLSPDAFLEAVREHFDIAASEATTPDRPGTIAMYLGGRWYRLICRSPSMDDPVARLDVSYLQDRLLAPVLGVIDPRTDRRIQFVGGIRGSVALKAAVDEGRCEVAFGMYPVTPPQIMDIADAGRLMPPKSTWFEPKLRSGLFVHTF